MRKKYSAVYILLGLLIIACIMSGCNFNEDTATNEPGDNTGMNRPKDDIAADGLTLLERMYDDIDQDGYNESIELYTSAEIAPDGQMGWDTGHQWVLLVRKGDQVFSLFDHWVQYGEVQFWIAYFNEDNVDSPENRDLRKKIYATVTDGVGFKLLSYSWDAQNMRYEEETVIDPPNQWGIRHSNKYNIPDPAKIELE